MCLYTRDHVWVDIQGARARAGLSAFAQEELGEIAYVDLPSAGSAVRRGDPVCTIDSLKSSTEVYAPLSGTVVEVNGRLASDEGCRLINSDPLGEGWIFVIEMNDDAEKADLLSEEDYFQYLN